MEKMLTDFVQLSKNKYIEQDTGYLICENAILGSTGYQEYYAWELGADNLPPNTRIKVYRPEEEVFKPESLRTLENKAICLLHPDQDVCAENDSQLRKGVVYNVRREGNVIKGTLQITDKDTIDKIKYTKCLSLGYKMDLEPSDRVEDDGTVFTARNIRYNHIAIVPRGRSKVAMITDNAIEDKNNMGGITYMSLFSRKDDVVTTDAEKEEVEEKETKTEKKEVSDDCGKVMDEESEAKKEKVEKRDEKEGAEEDTVTKEIEKRVAKGDYTQKDLEKLLEKLKKGDRKEIKEDYKEREEYEKDKKTKDSGLVSISTDEYKSLLMGQKGLVYGNDTAAFQKVEAPETKVNARDAETERRLYYKNTLNPHKNANWRSECGMISDLLDI